MKVEINAFLEQWGIFIRRPREGENRASCSRCDHGPQDDAVAVRIECDSATWICHRCGWTGHVSADRSTSTTRLPAPAPTSIRADEKRKRDFAREIWMESGPLQGTIGEAYLNRRACAIPKPDADIRFHPSLYCVKVAGKRAAIVCRVSTAIGNRGIGIHRLFLDPAGADRAIAKMRLGGCDEPVCIRLFADEDVTNSLAIAEGIETALSAAHLHAPVWSALDAGNLARFPVLPGIESLLIFADHDLVGLAAARTCAERWEGAGRRVTAVTTSKSGADINDVVREALDAA